MIIFCENYRLYRPIITFAKRKKVKSDKASIIVVISGPAIRAGSKCNFLARIGKEAPKHLAKMMTIYKVIATCKAILHSGSPSVELLIIPVFNSMNIQRKLNKATINPVIKDTRNSLNNILK